MLQKIVVVRFDTDKISVGKLVHVSDKDGQLDEEWSVEGYGFITFVSPNGESLRVHVCLPSFGTTDSGCGVIEYKISAELVESGKVEIKPVLIEGEEPPAPSVHSYSEYALVQALLAKMGGGGVEKTYRRITAYLQNQLGIL